MAYQPTSIVPDKGGRPGKNSSGADIAQFRAVQIVPAGTEDPTQIRLPSAAGASIYGVTMNAIKDGQIGDVQIEGKVPVLAGAGGIAVGADLAVTTAGAFVTAVTGNIVVAKCVKAAAAGAYGEAELGSPINSRTVP
jgi:hypothetical protein